MSNSINLTVWKELYPSEEFDLEQKIGLLYNSIYMLSRMVGHFTGDFRHCFNGVRSETVFEQVRDELKRPFAEADFITEVRNGIKDLRQVIDNRKCDCSVED